MKVDPQQTGFILVLFVTFLFVPQLASNLGTSLDTIPMRFALMILVLGALSYDKFIALALFLVVSALYVQHHQDDLNLVLGYGNDNTKDLMAYVKATGTPQAMQSLDQGGHADETTDTMDFVPKTDDQDNEFSRAGNSMDEKHVLNSEPLGSRSQNLFAEDSRNAKYMEYDNKNGHNE